MGICSDRGIQKIGFYCNKSLVLNYKQKGFTIDERTDFTTQSDAPIKIIPEEKRVIIFENHPSFIEEITVKGNSFKVNYLEWDPSTNPYSICKFGNDENEVIFNTNHPLFKSQLSDEIVKKMSLGVVL